MEAVTVYEKFLPLLSCDSILEYAKSNFVLDERIIYSNWHASINYDKSYAQDIHTLIKPISPFGIFHITWVNLTQYENNRELEFITMKGVIGHLQLY